MAHSLVCQLPSNQETIIINSLDLNIYSTLSKTNQIMSKYRPIAPKPQLSMHHHPLLGSTTTPPKSAQQPRSFFRKKLSPHLQTRPSRGCRKRTKAEFSPCIPKKTRPSSSLPSSSVAGNALLSQSMQQSFGPALPWITISRDGFDGAVEKLTNASANLVTILLPHPSIPTPNYYSYSQFVDEDEEVLDLNSPTTVIPRKHLFQELQAPRLCSKVISPQPMRPIGSSISVGCISEDHISTSGSMRAPKRPEEVEDEVESEALPAVISDSNNRVRLANSAYKEMVGQPECSWLDATYDARLRGCACKRIGGDVMLQLSDTTVSPASNGFSCRVRIEWGSDEKKSSIYAPCDVIRLSCVSKDYLFTWRFHTRDSTA